MKDVLIIPPALHKDPPPRKRPLIYVYNTPPQYTTRVHQYRLSRWAQLTALLGRCLRAIRAGGCTCWDA